LPDEIQHETWHLIFNLLLHLTARSNDNHWIFRFLLALIYSLWSVSVGRYTRDEGRSWEESPGQWKKEKVWCWYDGWGFASLHI